MGNDCDSKERIFRFSEFHKAIYTIEADIKNELKNKNISSKKYNTFGLINQNLCKKYKFLLNPIFNKEEAKKYIFDNKDLIKHNEHKEFDYIVEGEGFSFPTNFIFVYKDFMDVIKNYVKEIEYQKHLSTFFDTIIGGDCLLMKNPGGKANNYRYIILYNEIIENKGNEIDYILYFKDINKLNEQVNYILSNGLWKYFEKIGFKYSDEYLKFHEKGKFIGYIARNSHQKQIESYINKMKKKKEKQNSMNQQNNGQMNSEMNENLLKMKPTTSMPINSTMKINYELLLDSAILFFYNQGNLLPHLIGNQNMDFKNFKNMIMSKLGSNIKIYRSYQQIFDELLSKLDSNNIHQKKDLYNQSSQFDEKKAFEDFMNMHNNGGIFQKFLFIPKETTIFCNKCRMSCYKFFYDKFILIKGVQNLSQKLFLPEPQNNQKVMCSFCNGSITDCSIGTKILSFPEVLIVIIEPNLANYFKLSQNLKISDGKAIEYKLSQFIENNTNYFYVINTSNSNLCHKFNDQKQFGNGEQVQKKKPIVLFYCLNKNASFNANPNAKLNNQNIQNQQILNQNQKQNMNVNNQIPAIISQQQALQFKQQMMNPNNKNIQFNPNSNQNNGVQNMSQNPNQINMNNMKRGQNMNNNFQNINGQNIAQAMNINSMNNLNNAQNMNNQNPTNNNFGNNINMGFNNMPFNNIQMKNMQMNMNINNNRNGNNMNFNMNMNNNNGNAHNPGNFINNNMMMNNMNNNNMMINNNGNNMMINNMNNNNMMINNNMNNNNMMINNNMNNNNMMINNNGNNMMVNNNGNNMMVNNNGNNMMMNNNCNNMMINNNMNNNMPMNINNGNIMNNNMGMNNNNNAMMMNNGFLPMNNINNNFVNNMNGNNNNMQMQIMNNNFNNNINNNMPMNMNNNFNNNFNNVNNGFPNQPNPMPNSPQMQNNDNQINNQAANNVSQPNNKENEIFVTFTFQKNKEQIYIDVDKYATFSNALAMLENKYNWLKKIKQKKYYLNKKEIEPKSFGETLTKLHIKDNSDIIIVA